MEKDNYNKNGKKWNEEEENTLINLLKNNKTLEECSQLHRRTFGAIKSRIEYIIYKMIIIENKSIDELEYLKKYTDKSNEEIIKKYEKKEDMITSKKYKKDKLNINKNNFEEKILNELKEIKDILKQIADKDN